MERIEILVNDLTEENEIILTKEEYGQLLSNEFDNGYAKGYREALEQDSTLDKIKAEIEDLDIFYDNDYFSSNHDAMFKCSEVLQIIDKYKAGSNSMGRAHNTKAIPSRKGE